MKFFSSVKFAVALFFLLTTNSWSSGVIPESSVIIVEANDGEGAINIKNTDDFPVLLLTTLESIPDDKIKLLSVTPPAARLEPGKSQRVRFILMSKEPLKTERLARVSFEGIPPQQKGKSEVRMTIRQNLPIVIRPAGLEKKMDPWEKLVWEVIDNKLVVSNPSPYVVRLGQGVQTLPNRMDWSLPNAYVLPGQKITLSSSSTKSMANVTKVRISPATTWGFTVDSYDAVVKK